MKKLFKNIEELGIKHDPKYEREGSSQSKNTQLLEASAFTRVSLISSTPQVKPWRKKEAYSESLWSDWNPLITWKSPTEEQ